LWATGETSLLPSVVLTAFVLSGPHHFAKNKIAILDEKFIGKFDAISLLGSTEHITISSGYFSSKQNSYRDYSSLFNVLHIFSFKIPILDN
jgi:hypothetical protein